MISNITINDKDKFYYLGEQVNKNFVNLFDLEFILNSEYEFLFGYYEESSLVAFVHVTKSIDFVEIINIVVDNNFRRKGIASSLLEYIFNNFNDVKDIFLEVNEKNINAINLYKKSGFDVINVRKKYYGNDDALVMKKKVD